MKSLPKKFLEPRLDESYMYAPLSYLIIYIELKKIFCGQYYSDHILQIIKVHRPPDKMLHNFILY